jgi:oxidoreductase, gfo/idh/mocA family
LKGALPVIKFGIIGFGYMGHKHELKIAQTEGMELVGICDIDESRMDDASTPGVIKYTSADKLLENEDIDTVLIVVENHKHREMVEKAAKAGKNIICEKPVALSVKEYDEMIEICEKYGVGFTIHHQRRYDKDYRTMKTIYDQNTLGNVYTIQSMLYGVNGNMHDWHVYKKYGGGMLYDWGVHLIDQILWMVPSKVESVYAQVRNVINFEVDDYFKIDIKFQNNIRAEIELGTYFLGDKENWFEHHWFIGGDKGSAYSDGFFPTGKIVKTTRLLTNVPGETTMTFAGPTRSFGQIDKDILITEELPIANHEQIEFFENYRDAREGKTEFIIKNSEIRRVMQVLEAVWESSEKNEVIKFEGGL